MKSMQHVPVLMQTSDIERYSDHLDLLALLICEPAIGWSELLTHVQNLARAGCPTAWSREARRTNLIVVDCFTDFVRLGLAQRGPEGVQLTRDGHDVARRMRDALAPRLASIERYTYGQHINTLHNAAQLLPL